jgi:hypothetical protein
MNNIDGHSVFILDYERCASHALAGIAQETFIAIITEKTIESAARNSLDGIVRLAKVDSRSRTHFPSLNDYISTAASGKLSRFPAF